MVNQSQEASEELERGSVEFQVGWRWFSSRFWFYYYYLPNSIFFDDLVKRVIKGIIGDAQASWYTITVPYEHWWENETSVIVITNSNYLLTTSIITIFSRRVRYLFIIFLRDRITSLVDDDEDHYIMGYNFQKGKQTKRENYIKL